MPDLLITSLAALDLSAVRGVLGVLLGVGALIFFHELGHFLAAKWAGVKVEVFSLGFGNRLFGFERGGTDYRVSMLPLGGYVRMLGQADDDPGAAATADAGDFRNKSVGWRMLILSGGVVMNLIVAVVFMGAVFALGINFQAAEVGAIEPGSAAARADLRPGDVVVGVDGTEILGFQDLQAVVALKGSEVRLDVLRDGKPVETTAHPVRGKGQPYARLGVEPAMVIAAVRSDSPLSGIVKPLEGVDRADRLQNVSPVESRCEPTRRMSERELARALEAAPGRVAVTIARTTYDARGLPIATDLIGAEVDPVRRAERTIGLTLADDVYARGVTEDGPAAKGGLQVGDRLIALDGVEPLRHAELRDVIALVGARRGDAPVPLVVERGGERKELRVSIQLENPEHVAAVEAKAADPEARLALRRDFGRWYLGIAFCADVVASVDGPLPLADPKAEPVTLAPGDRLIEARTTDGLVRWSAEVAVDSNRTLRDLLRGRGEQPFRLEWLPKGATETRTAVVVARDHATQTWPDLGVTTAPRRVTVSRGFLEACVLGVEQAWVQTARIFITLRSLLTGSVSGKLLGGPIHIAQETFKVASGDSLAQLLHLLAILSLNLAVINVLPIPVLDGGHIMFLIYEKVKGRPAPPEVQEKAAYVGLALILGLMVLVFWNDISRILGLA